MPNDLLEYIYRCMLLDTDINIDGVLCQYVDEELIGIGLDVDTCVSAISNGTYKFPEYITKIDFGYTGWLNYVTLCTKYQLTTVDFNNIAYMYSLSGFSEVDDSFKVKTVIANCWLDMYVIPGAERVETLYVNGITSCLSNTIVYQRLKYLYAKQVSQFMPSYDTCKYLEEVYLDTAFKVHIYTAPSTIKIFYAPKVKEFYGNFKGCTELQKVDLGSARHLQSNAFYNCKSLKECNFEDIKSIGESCFVNCEALTELYFPNLEKVGNGSFIKCENLKKVTLGKINRVDSQMFKQCWALRDLIVGKDTTLRANKDTLSFTFRVKVHRI